MVSEFVSLEGLSYELAGGSALLGHWLGVGVSGVSFAQLVVDGAAPSVLVPPMASS